MVEDRYRKPVVSANDAFKAKYPKYLRWSAVVAVVLTALFFLFSPRYVPTPYRLVQRQMQVVDLPEQAIELPPPPEDVPPPPKEVVAAPDEEVTEEVDVASTLMDFDDAIATSTTDWGGGGGGEEFVASMTKPRITHMEPPEYTEMARLMQLEGTVIVKVLVGPDGSVLAAEIMQAQHPLLNREALKAAYKCKFEPGKQRNIPVKAWMAIPYTFRLH
jgi:protein TonB